MLTQAEVVPKSSKECEFILRIRRDDSDKFEKRNKQKNEKDTETHKQDLYM